MPARNRKNKSAIISPLEQHNKMVTPTNDGHFSRGSVTEDSVNIDVGWGGVEAGSGSGKTLTLTSDMSGHELEMLLCANVRLYVRLFF